MEEIIMASEKITAMIDEIKALSVLELKELVDEICETFGVSAVAAAAPAAGCRREDRIRRCYDQLRRREDQGHQGDPRHHRSWPGRGKGNGREGSRCCQGRHFQGRRRGSQGSARGSRRSSRDQVRNYLNIQKTPFIRTEFFFLEAYLV